MTGPNDSSDHTRPISVAELLAKNGTLGAPAVTTRRRRRRGNADAKTVAELTGEIPIIDERMLAEADGEALGAASAATSKSEEEPVDEAPEVVEEDVTPPAEADGGVDDSADDSADEAEEADDPVAATDDDVAADAQVTAAESDYEAHLRHRDSEPEPLPFAPRRPSVFSRATRPSADAADSGAEQMSPDPVSEDQEHEAADELAELLGAEVESFDDAPATETIVSSLPVVSSRPVVDRSAADEVFHTGPTRKLTGRSQADLVSAFLSDTDLDDAPAERASVKAARMPSLSHTVSTIGQCIMAVAFGGGLFFAFDQLWRWNNIVALVLSVLVILGLMVGVRVMRKADDVVSMLIAVIVGAMITLGPLALLQAG